MRYREALLQLVLIQHNMACLLNPVVYVGFKTFCNSNFDAS